MKPTTYLMPNLFAGISFKMQVMGSLFHEMILIVCSVAGKRFGFINLIVPTRLNVEKAF